MTEKETQPKEAQQNTAVRTQEALQLYASKNAIIQSYIRNGIELDPITRNQASMPHHTFTNLMMTHLKELDFVYNNDRFRLKTGGKASSTETLMYLLDMFFEWIDKSDEQIRILIQKEKEAEEEKEEKEKEAEKEIYPKEQQVQHLHRNRTG